MNPKLQLSLVLAAGLGLRLYQLGHDSFWIDEAGVALAILQSGLENTLNAIRQHVMAMPLDYLVAQVFVLFGLQEFWLRLPAVLWGTLTLYVSYRFFSRLANKKLALLAILLLAFAPLHIRFSQELRFYSALVFFYMLSGWLLLEAIITRRWLNWLWFVLAASVGAYFHIYVVLALINGPIYMLMQPGEIRKRSTWIRYILSSALVGVMVLPGLLFFGGQQQFHFPLLQYYSSIFELIVLAFGWVPSRYVPDMIGGFVMGAMLFGIELTGGLVLIKKKNWPVLLLVISAGLQIGFILLADWVKGYWVIYRQFIFLLPFSYYLAALGISAVGSWVKQQGALFSRPTSQEATTRTSLVSILAIFLLVLFTSANLLALSEYYRWEKSGARQISTTLANRWQPGEGVVVSPPSALAGYKFYLGSVLDKKEIADSLQVIPLDDLEKKIIQSNPAYLLISFPLHQELPERLAALGFEQVMLVNIENQGKQYLFYKP